MSAMSPIEELEAFKVRYQMFIDGEITYDQLHGLTDWTPPGRAAQRRFDTVANLAFGFVVGAVTALVMWWLS
jgi:hypothetical protein